MMSIGGVVCGLSLWRWHVQHVTTFRPEKLVLFSVSTIWIILRVVRFLAVSAGQSCTWHSRQHMPSAAEKRPIVPMNSSTGMPFRSCTFLNASSDICGCWADGAGDAVCVYSTAQAGRNE